MQDLRQKLVKILEDDPFGGAVTNPPAKIARQEASAVPLSRDQELGDRRAVSAPAARPATVPPGKFLPMAPPRWRRRG